MMHVQILGTRGIPSQHGGFETFAHDLALFLTAKGHRVTVYCQVSPPEKRREDIWQGVRRVLIPAAEGSIGSIEFDLKSAVHASCEDGIALTLGYNTAIFSFLYLIRNHRNIMNMDGLEWKRKKWSLTSRAWLRLNEWLGSKLSDHLIADHPMIAKHLGLHANPSKITMIPYGSFGLDGQDATVIEKFDLLPKQYYLMIARPEPENSVLEIVSAYSAQSRKMPLVVLGKYSSRETYHASVLNRAGSDVRFLGPIYERATVAALRRHASAYIHGHQVGGTNPSLVESLATGNPIIAHDNVFTRWVVGDSGLFFSNEEALTKIFDHLDASQACLEPLGLASRIRYQEAFRQEDVLLKYEALLERFSEGVAAATVTSVAYSPTIARD
jgi:glycosyltransferase involved in cell wall biosynthesis